MTPKQRQSILSIAGLSAFLFMLSMQGCATATSGTAPVKEAAIQKQGKDHKQSKYYHYTLSQLHAKKGKFNSAAKHLKTAIKMDPDSYFLKKELAVLYLKARKPEKALAEVRKLIAEKPDDVETLVIFGRMCQILKTDDDITTTYEKVISLDPERKQIYLLLGRLYQDQNLLEDALRVYSAFNKKYPDSYIGHYYQGHVNLMLGHFSLAETSLRKALDLNPSLNEARFDLVEIEKNRKGKGSILDLYEKILEIDPSETKAALHLSLHYLKSGDTEKSDLLLQDIVSRKTPEKKILTIVVEDFIENDNYDDALILLLQLLKLDPHKPVYHYLAGICCNSLDKTGQALEHFYSIDEKSEFYHKASIQTAIIYNDTQGPSKAITFLEKRLQTDPDNLDFIFYIGQFHEDLEQYEQAEHYFKKGLDLEPDTPKLHFRLGAVYDKMGKKEDCIIELKRVLELEPDNANALNYIGYTYAELGRNLDEAEAMIKKALTIRPEDGYITDSLGWVYFKKGLFEKAVTVLEKASLLVPNDPVLLEHLGDAYQKVSKSSKALEAYRKALKLKKKDKEILEQKIRNLTREKK